MTETTTGSSSASPGGGNADELAADLADAAVEPPELAEPATAVVGGGQLAKVLRATVSVVLVAVVVWWLFIANTAANNDVFGGIRQLFNGLGKIPRLVFQTAAYRDWWQFMLNDPRGFDGVFGHLWNHVQLVATSMFFATIVSVLLGIAGHRVPAIGNFATALASIALTLPSLALFAIFMTFVGTGDRGPIIALTMYSVLPILRNTLTGLHAVDRAVVESARGVGLSPMQCLYRIELPLAWPVILTGIRIATLLNIGIAAIATLVGGGGLGNYINQALNIWGRPQGYYLMWSAVIFTILLALVADLLFTTLRTLTTSKGIRK